MLMAVIGLVAIQAAASKRQEHLQEIGPPVLIDITIIAVAAFVVARDMRTAGEASPLVVGFGIGAFAFLVLALDFVDDWVSLTESLYDAVSGKISTKGRPLSDAVEWVIVACCVGVPPLVVGALAGLLARRFGLTLVLKPRQRGMPNSPMGENRDYPQHRTGDNLDSRPPADVPALGTTSPSDVEVARASRSSAANGRDGVNGRRDPDPLGDQSG
jgi:hypothetical protein